MDQKKIDSKKEDKKVKTRKGSGYLKQLYSTARVTANSTHSNLKNLTTFLVNFIPTEKVLASELQVRSHFDDEEIQALSLSIKEHGVLQPILVIQDGDQYKVIAGERRLRASKLAGVERIPARVLTTDDKATHEIALRENLDRVDLHPIAEGEGYLSLLEAKAYTSYEAIAKAFGKAKSRVTECIGYTRLPQETKAELLRVGLKNRALLRKLLGIPPETHKEIIREAASKEEILLSEEQIAAHAGEGSQETKEAKLPPPKKEPKPFIYKMDKKGISVPGFRWKAGEGQERLKDYASRLKNLLQDVENRLDETPKKSP